MKNDINRRFRSRQDEREKRERQKDSERKREKEREREREREREKEKNYFLLAKEKEVIISFTRNFIKTETFLSNHFRARK